MEELETKKAVDNAGRNVASILFREERAMTKDAKTKASN